MRIPPRRPLEVTRIRTALLETRGILKHNEQHLGLKDNPLNIKQADVQILGTVRTQDPHPRQ